MPIPANARFQCDFSIGEAIGSFIIWILLTIVTLGLASFVAPYYVLSAIINKTWIIDENGRKLAQLQVNFTLAEIVGHAVIWVLLALVTLGLAIIVYYYMVAKKVLEPYRNRQPRLRARTCRSTSRPGAIRDNSRVTLAQ